MPTSFELLQDRVEGLHDLLRSEQDRRSQLEERTAELERMLDRHAEDLDTLLEDAAAPALAPAPIGSGRHARKLDRWLDGDGGGGGVVATTITNTRLKDGSDPQWDRSCSGAVRPCIGSTCDHRNHHHHAARRQT